MDFLGCWEVSTVCIESGRIVQSHGKVNMKGHHDPTTILQAVVSYDLQIWHAFFGTAGSHNDINVLDRSPLFNNPIEGRTPPVNYSNQRSCLHNCLLSGRQHISSMVNFHQDNLISNRC